MPDTAIRTQNLPGSDFMGPMETPRKNYKTESEYDSNNMTVELVAVEDNEATQLDEGGLHEEEDKEDEEQTIW
jgi:hypothetical protein